MDLTKNNNNKGKKNMFMCFRPVSLNSCSVNRSRKGPLSKSLSDNSLVTLSNKNAAIADCVGRKEKPRRRLTRVLKAVLFDASLSKRIRNQKPPLNSVRSHNNLSSIQKNDNSSNQELSERDDMSKINSSRSTSPHSSTNSLTSLCSNCSCSIAPNSPERSGSSGTKSEGKKSLTKLGSYYYYSSNRGLCLLLSCLMVMIFWGKICAICCTLTWLLFAPRRFNVVDSPVIDSDQY